MLPYAQIVHKTKDRLRLKIADKRGNYAFFSESAEKIKALDGIKEISFNPATGTILLTFTKDADTTFKELMTIGVFTTNTAEVSYEIAKKPTEQVGRYFGILNDKMKEITSGDISFGDLAFLSLFFNGIYQFVRRDITMPPWYTSLWYAYGVFSRIRSKK
ncbi:MAG: hypothetical protein L3V56_01110 [Candidatus Magnetoovum sp. WYHC-5]|nr:hypothetical protein [Candidatus Magnetoovum sp. WYHC-5]